MRVGMHQERCSRNTFKLICTCMRPRVRLLNHTTILIQFMNSEVKDPGLLNLIAQLTGLLLQVEVSILDFPQHYALLCMIVSIRSALFADAMIVCSCLQSLSESGNSLDLSSLTTSLGELEKGVQPLNRK